MYSLPVLRPYYGCATREVGAMVGGRGGWEVFPTLSWKSKKVPWFWKKGPDCIHFCVIFSIQNVVLRVSRGEKCKSFPCEAFFSCVFVEMFIEVPKFHETYSALKNFLLRACVSFGNLPHPQTRSSHDFLARGLGCLIRHGYWSPKFSFSWCDWQLEISDLVNLVG